MYSGFPWKSSLNHDWTVVKMPILPSYRNESTTFFGRFLQLLCSCFHLPFSPLMILTTCPFFYTNDGVSFNVYLVGEHFSYLYLMCNIRIFYLRRLCFFLSNKNVCMIEDILSIIDLYIFVFPYFLLRFYKNFKIQILKLFHSLYYRVSTYLHLPLWLDFCILFVRNGYFDPYLLDIPGNCFSVFHFLLSMFAEGIF